MCWERQLVIVQEPYSERLRLLSAHRNAISRWKGVNMTETMLNYKENGDYLIPDVELQEMEGAPLGKYGKMRRAYLEENNPILYNDLVLREKLFTHLREIDQTARLRTEQMMTQLLKQNPAPDKKTNQMGWVQHLNSLRAQVDEVIMAELINS